MSAPGPRTQDPRLLVKICGLTCAEDAEAALEAGADLLGFVVHPPSPRHCSDVRAASAPAGDRGVLVMVADSVEAVLRMAEAAGLRRVQPHLPAALRAEAVARCQAEGLELLLPWPDEPDQTAVEAPLFLWEPSPARTGLAGGSGQVHAGASPPPGPFLLAGGLGPDNVQARIQGLPETVRVGLRGVDAASRLERIPGRKDEAKMRDFIQAFREVNHAH